jgi:hypothetical protein
MSFAAYSATQSPSNGTQSLPLHLPIAPCSSKSKLEAPCDRFWKWLILSHPDQEKCDIQPLPGLMLRIMQVAIVAWFGFLRVLVFPYMSTPSIPDDDKHNISATSYTRNACATDTIITLIGMWITKIIGDTYQGRIDTKLNALKTDTSALKKHFEEPNGLIPTMQEDVSSLKEDVTTMKGDIKMILNKLNGLFPAHFDLADINSIDYPRKVTEGTVLIDIVPNVHPDAMTANDLPDTTEGLVKRNRNQNTQEYLELQNVPVRFGTPSYQESVQLRGIRDDMVKKISHLKQE